MTNGGYLSIIGILIALILFQRFEHRSDMESMKQSFDSLIEFQKNELNSRFAGKDIMVKDIKEMKQNQVASLKELKSLNKAYSDLKKVNAVIKAELATKIKGTIKIFYDTTYLSADTGVFIHRDSISKYFIPKQSKALHSEMWYDISTTIGDSLTIDSLNVYNKIDVILGYKKPDKAFKFLRKSEPIVSIQSYNPYSKIENVNNLIVNDNRSKVGKLATSKLAGFTYGILGGFLLFSFLK